MSANDLIPFWKQQFKNGCFAAFWIWVIFWYLSEKKMQNSWTMNIKQNGRSHSMTTYDEFRTNKIQNGPVGHFKFFSDRHIMNVVGKIHTYFRDFVHEKSRKRFRKWFYIRKICDRWRLCSVKNIVYSFPKCGCSEVSYYIMSTGPITVLPLVCW